MSNLKFTDMNNKVTFYAGNYTLHGNFKPMQPRPPKARTPHQKTVLMALVGGGVLHREAGKFRVRKNGKALHWLSVSGFLQIHRYLKPQDGNFILDRRAVERSRPNTWVKKYFLTVKEPQQ